MFDSKKGGIMASSYVGGLSGAFIPVSEDQGMINAVEAGALTIEKLEDTEVKGIYTFSLDWSKASQRSGSSGNEVRQRTSENL